jgi:hypothetical protein
LCKQAKERKFETKIFTTTSSGDSITSQNDEILELNLRLEREIRRFRNNDFDNVKMVDKTGISTEEKEEWFSERQ